MVQGFSFLGDTTSLSFWALWSLALVLQNYAFTRVSRARNSASIKAHALASLQSNGAWFIQSLFVYSAFMNILTGKAGIWKALGAGLYYTFFTMAGSIYAHHVSLKKEKGKSAVGANDKYAQIPVKDWERVWKALEQSDQQQISLLMQVVESGDKAFDTAAQLLIDRTGIPITLPQAAQQGSQVSTATDQQTEPGTQVLSGVCCPSQQARSFGKSYSPAGKF